MAAPSIAVWALLATVGSSVGEEAVQADRQPQRLLVAPHGGTDTRQSPNGPLSLGAALEEATRRRVADAATPLELELQPGTYDLDKPIVIDARLAGDGGITLKAKPGADVRLVGWKKVESIIPPAKDIEDQLPAIARGKIKYYALPQSEFPDLGVELPRGHSLPRHAAEMEFFLGDTPLSPARWPATGYSEIMRAVDGSRVVIRDAPLSAVAGRTDVWFAGFPGVEWGYERVQVADVDPVSGVIRAVRPFSYPPRWRDFAALEGPPTLFSAPNQFYFDRANRVLAVWAPVNDARTIQASILTNAIVMTGARHVRIEGLSVLGVRGDAIRVVNSDDVQLDRIQVADAGMRGVAVEGGHDFLLQNSVIHDTGDEGAWVTGGDRQNLVSAGHRILSNTLFRFGRRIRSGRDGIRIDGVGIVVEDNVLSNGPSQAIGFQGNDHLIRHNDISRTMSECGDCAAIYTGRDWSARGTCIDGNVIHGITPAPDRDVSGIYLDDAASGIVVWRNAIVSLRRGVLVGGGRDNIVMENTITDADQFGVLLDGRGLSWAKASVNDPSSEIRRRLVAVPYDREPYRSRYPHLAELLQEQPGQPRYNLISGNTFVRGAGVVLEDPALRALVLTTPQKLNEANGQACPPQSIAGRRGPPAE
ncbi:right-handed parallel beta-helix repeat-containing protein [Bradyrhizobium sp. CIAT3101]|uniref:right-handed parallel beta-helix repeat-containing protein n=1 Tax=Bradyrhizobium sp. CIAT3101 TaxID=439387 RepID=UPI0024B06B1E|nr:right-handed parallel beta-helix repeat-containing protein [Bradyrhizobium sp. CIAT3101]WFU84456.1 right-handed parallel beta-helix repeat-containing protein [Bradyrhizobium sp. CIAT3101]